MNSLFIKVLDLWHDISSFQCQLPHGKWQKVGIFIQQQLLTIPVSKERLILADDANLMVHCSLLIKMTVILNRDGVVYQLSVY